MSTNTDNSTFVSIETDRAISTILENFSEDFINDSVSGSLEYKFRPFDTRMPNFPAVLENNFKSILSYSAGYEDQINEKRLETYYNIIEIICENYNLSIVGDGIPDEYVYQVCYFLYQILLSEFTERMIWFLSNYIIQNVGSLLSHIPEDKRIPKTNYAKRIYQKQDYIALYDNMEQVLSIVASLDIPFSLLITYLADNTVADLLSRFIVDNGDIYKYHFARYIIDPSTRIDMITTIKLNIVSMTAQNDAITNPSESGYFK